MKIVVGFIGLCITILGVGRWIKHEKDIEPNRTDELTYTGVKTIEVSDTPTPLADSGVLYAESSATNNTSSSSQFTTITPAHETILPKSVNLEVPFYVQAPDNKRVLPWTETCEEASLVLAAYYIKGSQLTKDQFKQDMLSLIDVEKKLFNTYIDTNILQLEELYKTYYNDGTTKIIDNPTIDQIKQELNQGHIIVAPFAGRELGNPHFSGDGPRYHMLVIRGYDNTYFYTNDVGTIHGENFAYTYDIIINAMHDLADGDISDGAKRMLVISK